MRVRRSVVFVACAVVLVAAACTPGPVGTGPDVVGPVLDLPADFTVLATEPAGAEVTWTASAFDAVDGVVVVTCSPEPGFFTVGVTEVSCTATDSAGNASAGGFMVTVTAEDVMPPVLTLPTGIDQPAVDAAGAPVMWTATAVDDVDGAVTPTCLPGPGQFPLGDTVVTCTASDVAGNTATGTFTVTVADVTAPVLTLPADIVTPATTATGAPVVFTATAVDAVDGTVPASCSPTPAEFPIGSTAVSCTATDAAGNIATGSFTVTVEFTDVTPPVLELPADIQLAAIDAAGATATWEAAATDDVDGDVPVDCTPTPGVFPLGSTTVSCTATDAAGNTGTGSFTVDVVDLTPPVLSLPADFSILATGPTGAAVDFAATAADNVDGALDVNCVPPSGSEVPVGDTEVTCSAADTAGNSTSDAFTVTVIPFVVPIGDSIAAGEGHTCSVTADHSVVCSGSGQYGQTGSAGHAQVPATITGVSDAVAVGAGRSHSCVALGDGSVKCWGLNTSRQLGNGLNANSAAPVDVIGVDGAVAVTGGLAHSCALIDDGSVRCWGSDLYGALGNGTAAGGTTAVTVTGLTDAVAIDAGDQHTCALRASGAVVCWGNGASGRLGRGSTASATAPVAVTGIVDAVAVSAGEEHSCAALSSGGVSCWGNNGNGRLGDGTSTQSLVPVAVSGLVDAVDVAAGDAHTCAVSTDGTTRCWGSPSYGRLGNGISGTSSALVPIVTQGPGNAVGVIAGAEHTCATTATGAAYCWGQNYDGRAGGADPDRTTPGPALQTGATSVVANDYTTCALTSSSAVRCWGAAPLGNGTNISSPTPVAATPTNVTELAAGLNSNSCARTTSGTVWCWGGAFFGYGVTPTAVAGINDAIDIGAGWATACAVRSIGSVSCWGTNGSGQLGDGTSGGSSTSPVTVVGITDAIRVDGGGNHSCVLRSGGTVKCFGRNSSGELGDGTTTDSPTPVTVNGVTGATAISVGFRHSCALLGNGTVKCWGGSRANGTTGDSPTPVTVPGISTAVAIDAGSSQNCALLQDSTVKCWGFSWGTLGDTTTTGSATPITVAGIADATSVAAGNNFTCLTRSDTSVWCWGWNGDGQLGDGLADYIATPRQVTGFS